MVAANPAAVTQGPLQVQKLHEHSAFGSLECTKQRTSQIAGTS